MPVRERQKLLPIKYKGRQVASNLRIDLLKAEITTRLYRAIVEDLESGVFLHVSLARAVHREAERFLLSLRIPLRSLDSLHLALAVTAGAATVVTFDHHLGKAATAIGLNSFPPR